MSRSNRCVSRARSVVIWSSFVLAIAGWVASGGVWLHFGVEAGIRPSFIVALSVGITFTITCCQTIVLPDKSRIFALGYREGLAQGLALNLDPEEPRLRSVR